MPRKILRGNMGAYEWAERLIIEYEGVGKLKLRLSQGTFIVPIELAWGEIEQIVLDGSPYGICISELELYLEYHRPVGTYYFWVSREVTNSALSISLISKKCKLTIKPESQKERALFCDSEITESVELGLPTP